MYTGNEKGNFLQIGELRCASDKYLQCMQGSMDLSLLRVLLEREIESIFLEISQNQSIDGIIIIGRNGNTLRASCRRDATLLI